MTAKQKTIALLREHQAAAGRTDFAARFDHWQKAVRKLSDRVRDWIGDAESADLLRMSSRGDTVRERFLGDQTVTFFQLTTAGGDVVEFEPVSAFVLGADGRVDVRGPLGERKLLYDAGRDRWSFTHPVPGGRWETVPLTEASFWATLGSLLPAPPDPEAD